VRQSATQPTPDPISLDLDSVQDALGSALRSRLRGEGEPRLIRSEDASFPYSRVRHLRFDQSGARVDIFLKRVVPSHGPLERVKSRLKREAELLSQLGQQMPGRVVPFVALFIDQLTLVTEGCRGDQFDHLLVGSPISVWWPQSRRRLIKISTGCGAWLERFHSLTRDPYGDLGEWLEFQSGEAEWRARQLTDLDPRNSGLYQGCAKKLDSELSACRLPGLGCTTHGDYAPHNIFVDEDDQIQVLDFFAAQRGHPLADVVNYIAKIACFAESPLFPKTTARALCEAFLAGYRKLHPSEHQVLRLLLVLQTLKRMLVLRSRRTGRAMALVADPCRDWYAPYLESYLSTGSRDASTTWPWPFVEPVRLRVR
jgi:serine/threonine protein kinase